MALTTAARWRRPDALQWAALLPLLVVAAPLAGIAVAAAGGTPAPVSGVELARYLATTAALALGVGLVAAVIGTATAWAVASYRFPGRGVMAWALALPLAFPPFALAYAYADLFDGGRPVMLWLRAAAVWDAAVPVRSLGGAVAILGLAFYPYVFLTMRVAFGQQERDVLEAARTLGARPGRLFRAVALPLARPALGAGMALAMMEALADYGAVQFLAVQTQTTAVVRAWTVWGSPGGAAQLALPLLGAAAALLWLERRGRTGAIHGGGRDRHRWREPVPVAGWRGWVLSATCAAPLLLGAVVPALYLAVMAWDAEPDWARLIDAGARTATLAAAGAALTAAGALLLVLGLPRSAAANRLTGLGYATPGAAMAIGLLGPAALLWQGLGYSAAVAVALLLLAYAARLMAAAAEPLAAGHARVAPGLGAAARTLGRSRTAAAFEVEAPLLGSAALTAALLVFVDIAKELPATLVLRPFDFDTLAVLASNYALDERLAQAAAPSLLIVALCAGPMIALARRMERAA